MSDRLLRLTPEEARALAAELSEVIGRYRRHDPRAPAPEGTERVSVIRLVLPDPEAGP